jgi:hypothetical protein
VRLGREACHVAYSSYDPGGQDGTYAEDLGEGGARGLHLGLYATVQVGDLPVQRPDVAQYLRGQAPPEAGRGALGPKCPWAEVPLGRSALGPNASQEAPGPVGRELPHHPAGEEVPQERVETVERPGALCDQVTKRLSESRRIASEADSGSTRARRSLREAASALARASSSSLLRASPAKLESSRTRAESLGATSTTDSPEPANLPAR